MLLDPVYFPSPLNGAVVRRNVMSRIQVLFPEPRVPRGGIAALVLESPGAGDPAGVSFHSVEPTLCLSLSFLTSYSLALVYEIFCISDLGGFWLGFGWEAGLENIYLRDRLTHRVGMATNNIFLSSASTDCTALGDHIIKKSINKHTNNYLLVYIKNNYSLKLKKLNNIRSKNL